MIKVFVERNILSIETILSAYARTHARTHAHARARTHMKVIGGDSVLFKSVQNVGLPTFSISNCCYISGQEQAYRLVQFKNDSSFPFVLQVDFMLRICVWIDTSMFSNLSCSACQPVMNC